MTLNGTATLEIAPDTADMHITLAAELPRPKQAASSVRAKQQALSKALAAIGLASDDISLSYLSISPVYDEHGHLLDYSAAITVTASTHDFDRLAEIMEAAANSGATSTSTDFRVADMATLKKKVRAQALAALKDKADQMSSSLGIKLGRIRAVAENQGGDGWAWNGSVTVSNSVDFAPRAPTASGARAEAQSLTLTVSATYELT
ncbi:MAG TPA: SIMPL domain-containing protein [Kofleriaceae bacterium]|jgi:uncharacterized protein YggE|nr:SIMPL domain-containing protein [Kofleriaceae bacterium]